MSTNWQKDIVEFQTKMGQEWHTKLTFTSDETLKLRYNLVDEEVNKELLPNLKKLMEEEPEDPTIVNVVDGIVDSIYVLIGCAVSFGVDLGPIWDKVHEANMLKADGLRDKNGKVLKPEGWKHPDIAKLIEDQKLGLPEFCDLCGYLAVDTTGYHCGNSDYKKLTSELRPKEIPRPIWCTLSERKLLEGEINGKT
jgi:hypothetical protein